MFRSRVLLGVVAVAVAGGCGTPSTTPTTSSSTTPSTPSTTPQAPVKYTPAGLRSCAEIGQKVGDLPPPPRKDETGKGANGFSLTCPFRSPSGELVVLRVEAWENSEDANGFHTGAERAKQDFASRAAASEEPDSGVGVGSAARWTKPEAGGGCALEVLDENAVLRTFRNSGKGEDPRGEQCRGRVRDLAKRFFTAIQPR